MLSDPVLVITLISKALDGLGIVHFIGGSLASSAFGIPRSTQDADIVADLRTLDVPLLASVLDGEFYIDEAMALDLTYLHRWAENLGLSGLLQKALAESGILKK